MQLEETKMISLKKNNEHMIKSIILKGFWGFGVLGFWGESIL